MSVQIKVPSMMCQACVNAISTEIKANLPEAKIAADLESKMVTVDANASKAAIAEMIAAAGHETEN
ncbi:MULTISPECIES: cation transporter [Spirulina sp. CCY15215]|uniref:heavy-metal-associated domain-containing protein n=1 Tax=Spirulina sp. CCY15215 TaxID=2767591 RepID=UPI00195248D1|nr:cation transporter [Spirulina major]